MALRYGIIGTGMMGCEHIRNLNLIDEAEITAVADPNPRSRHWALKACAERFKPAVFEDYRDLLARDDVDALVIASPNFTHIDVMRDVFRTDKHVLLEKPMCTTLADCHELVASANRHPGLVWVALEYRYMAPIAATLRHLPSIGRIQMCSIREHRFPFLEKVDDWNRFNRNTGGTLVEKCCHFFDMMNLVIPSRPVRVIASGAQDVNHLDETYDGEIPDILDNAYVIVDYEGGQRASLDLCMFAEGSRHEQQIVVTGDRGRIEATVPGNQLYLSKRADRSVQTITIEQDPRVRTEGFHHGASFIEHLEFIDAIKNRKPPQVTARDGLLSVIMGIAAHQSIETGQAVKLDHLLNTGS